MGAPHHDCGGRMLWIIAGGVPAPEEANVMSDSPEVMNIRQASGYLGVSPDTLYKYVSEDKIPAFKLGNRWKFKKALLDRWMESKSSGGEGELKKKPRAVRTAAAR